VQILRPYQTKAVAKTLSAWRSYRAPLLVMPTGSGKTTVVVHIVAQTKGRVLFLCPWRQLVFQAITRLEEHGISCGILMGPKKPKESDRVHVATIQTAAKRDLGNYDLVIIDEAHRAPSHQCREILKNYKKLLGLTATPIRMDGKRLSSVFDVLVEPVTVNELIGRGHLVPPKVYAPEIPINFKGLRYDAKKRDYASGAAGKVMSSPRLVGDAIEHWSRLGRGKKTFTFCSSVAHAETMVEAFKKAGVTAALMCGATTAKQRKELFEQLDNRQLQVICNVAVLTEGVDFPDLGCIVLLRPTLSKGLHYQIVGRGMRPYSAKQFCLVLDHSDNFRRHGFPQDQQKWSLTSSRKQLPPGRGKGKAPDHAAKECPGCGVMVPSNCKKCPECEFVWLPETSKGRLALLTPKRQDRQFI